MVRVVTLLCAMTLGWGMAQAQPVIERPTIHVRDLTTTVYFDYGQNELGMAGRLLVREMAAKARASGYDMATVVGHTDRAGPDERNLQDGRARAAAVARILAEQGFAGSAVRVETAGESQPIRVHEDERREPLNRRAVVVFSSTH